MKAIDHVLAKQVNRKEFLGYLGTAALAVTGVAGITRSLRELDGPKHQASGYGSTAYGGAKSDFTK